jgi:hypothetical protein
MMRMFQTSVKSWWKGRRSTVSSDIPEFLKKGKRPKLAQGEFLVPAGYADALDTLGSSPRCRRGKVEEWLSLIGYSESGVAALGSPEWAMGEIDD